MVALNLAPSWSQYSQTPTEILLDATLISIALVWYELKYWKGAAAFIGILLTDVNVDALVWPHYIMTGLGAVFSVWYTKRIGNIQFYSGLLGLLLFLLGFLTKLYSTGVGEWLLLVPISVAVAFQVNQNDR